MSRLNSSSREVWAKLAIYGAAGDSCTEILQGVSDHYAAELKKEELGDICVLSTDFTWPQVLPNDWRLKLHLYGLPEPTSYNAVNELLLKDVDGVVFSADVSNQETLQAAVEAMKLMVFNLQRQEYDLLSLPVSLLYHRTEAHAVFQPELMDQFLGLPVGSLPRFWMRTGDEPLALSGAVNHVSERLHASLSQELEPELVADDTPLE